MTFTRPVLLVIAVGALLLATWWLWTSLTSGNRAKVEARLNRNQAGAAVESGRDAVNTTATTAARERASEDLTRSNERTIRDAEGANAPVSGAVRDAGLASLCRRAAYREHPECVQRAATR